MKVGVTGHQDFASSEVQKWVEQEIRNNIATRTIEVGFTCLARGADQIFAEVLLQQHVPYTAIIASHDYEKTFPEGQRAKYRELLAQAQSVVKLDNQYATEEAFFSAGKEVVQLSDFIIAVWNGLPAKGLGGTADIVKYAFGHNKPVLHIDTTSRTVTKISP